MRFAGVQSEKDKNGLVEELAELIHAWNGRDPLMSRDERAFRAVMDLLWRHRLVHVEEHWLAQSEIWIGEARRKPEPWLKAIWLQTVGQWRDYLASIETETASVASTSRPRVHS